MRLLKYKKYANIFLLGLLIACGSGHAAYSLQSSSSSYGVDEAFFGNGGQFNACSSTYCSNQTAGELGVGNSKSDSYQVQAGSDITDRAPYLEFIVNNSTVDLGTLTTTTTATATATFSVKTYLAGGYTVVNASPGPQNGGYTLHTLSTPTGSSIGNEQFGMNLVANTNPASFGAGPQQAPDSTFGFGQVASGYDTPNLYKYVNGDTIAYSNSSSGETDYTISYIYNISNLTPGGFYTLYHDLVATSTY
ncbi:MAG TPA: hypothetical protein VFH39_02900 [Candidatus Saccharimonadales bacterium]|nr:hypothetical protein [Candidatus Saccharimonadales bacterium]